jgi:hypothetical protein
MAELDRPRRTTEADVEQSARQPRAVPPMGQSPAAEDRPVGVDRNSGAYFRRLSMLPPSTISKSVPLTLLHFVDAIRGILFALSQLHSALKQFIVFATPDRLPAALARMMANSDGSLSRLINALDRFDSSTRRSTPSSGVLREVFDACRDNVASFGKLVAVLALQLKPLVGTADVRYTRTLLLMLYGSMAEVANAWRSITPLAGEIGALIRTGTDPVTAAVMLQPPTPSPKFEDVHQLPSIAPGPPQGASGVPPLSSSNGTPVRSRGASSSATARRHAGSFSVEDVRVGAALPQHSPTSSVSMVGVGIVPNGLPPSTLPPVSAAMRPRPGAPKLTMPLAPLPLPASTLSLSQPAPTMPAYRDIFEHLNDLPPTPIGLGPSAGDNGPPSAYPLPSSLSTSTSALPTPTLAGHFKRPSPPPSALTSAPAVPNEGGVVDDFLEMVDTTTNVAFSVCALLVERPLAGTRAAELVDMCEVGKEAARRLKGDLARLPGASASPGSASLEEQGGKWRVAARAVTAQDAKRLWDNSNAFAKVRSPCSLWLPSFANRPGRPSSKSRPWRERSSKSSRSRARPRKASRSSPRVPTPFSLLLPLLYSRPRRGDGPPLVAAVPSLSVAPRVRCRRQTPPAKTVAEACAKASE